MTSPAKHSRLGLVLDACLAALALTLLSLVMWQNREKIVEVFRRRLDLRLSGSGGDLSDQSADFLCCWYMLVRVIEPRFKLRATLLLGCIGYVFGLVIPGPVRG